VIFVGLDDTDIEETRGTNAIAREIMTRLGLQKPTTRLVRHQLLDDPRVPYTSRNGSASIVIEDGDARDMPSLFRDIRGWMLEWFIEGSDPGLCITDEVPEEIVAFAQRCKRELIDQGEARKLARKHGIQLEGLGGTEQGVIGALAAIGLVSTGFDGRIVHLGGWPWPDDAHGGVLDAETILARGVDEIRVARRVPINEKTHDVEPTNEIVRTGKIDIVKNLRPNLRGGGRIVLYVEATPDGRAPWRALKPT
jgi:hypothetical protein